MNTVDKIANDWLGREETALGLSYDNSGLKASGRWKKDLEQFYSRKGSKINMGILGSDYTEYLENGRRPNKKKSHKELVGFALWSMDAWTNEWLSNKGLTHLNAFGVAYNIGKFGIKVPNKNNAGGLVSDVINDAAIEELNKELSLFYINDFSSEVSNLFSED